MPGPGMEVDLNWCAVLAHHARTTPAKPLCVFGGEPVTYAEMAERSAALAGGLAARGVGPGAVVGLLSYNCPELLETIFAANHLGAVAMPINWRLAAPEIRYILEHSEASALVCDRSLLDLADEATKGLGSRLVRAAISARAPGWVPLDELRAAGAPPPAARVGPDDVHRLMYTSGTTGRPKGVMLTHANLAWKNLAHLVELGVTAADLGLACGPLYHVGALDLTTTTLIAAGATSIIHRVFDAAEVVDERCLRRARWILGMRSALGESELLRLTPALVKVCSSKFVPELVKRALPGMKLTHLPVPPSAIRAEADMQYFSIEIAGPCWEHILQTHSVGIYIPGEITNPEFDLTVIVETS